MVTHLLESGTRRRSSIAGAIPSIALHSVLILAAINATAHAALRAPDRPHIVPLPLYPPRARITPAERQHASGVRSPNRAWVEAAPTITPTVPSFPDHTFSFDAAGVHTPVIHGQEFRDGVKAGGGTNGSDVGSIAILSSERVDRQAEPLAGTLAPHYPDALRASGLEGTVVARFVVDSAGRVEDGSFVTAGSANPLFVAAVENALSRARFRPAESHGMRVRQLVEQSFTFVLH
ncbi:MAG TPA: energy transducer TonB [Gemmatimonadaceae bacterium]|nr:energy transducer TonB [Gemmatimonadaceae bacterium]